MRPGCSEALCVVNYQGCHAGATDAHENRIGLLDRTRLGANTAYSGSYSYSANPNRAPNVCTSWNDLLAHCLTSRVSSVILSPPMERASTPLSAPIELADKWGRTIPRSAQSVAERTATCVLWTGSALHSFSDPSDA